MSLNFITICCVIIFSETNMADNIQQNLRLYTVRAIGNKFTDILTAVTIIVAIIIKVIVNNFTSTSGLFLPHCQQCYCCISLE